MEIIIPQLERFVYKEAGNKNVIKQLLAPGFSLDTNITIVSRNLSFVETNTGDKIFFSSKEENFTSEHDFAILTNKAPSQENFGSGNVIAKKWLKHPLLQNHSACDVINSWDGKFSFKEEDLSKGINGLRQPQIGALHMLMGHLKLPLEIGTIVLPTGTGKTETMLSALIAHRCSKLLVTVPSDSLRTQIADKFISLGLLRKFGIVANDILFPIVGIIRQGFSSNAELKHFFENCNVIVTTMSILTGCPEDFQKEIASLCSHVFIDEAHHVKATSWNEFKNQFPASKVVQFTATPFRNDGKRLDGKIIFNFPLKNAQEQGYFKSIDFIPIREYDTEKADKIIAQIAISQLRKDISAGFNHILMARCGTKEKARRVFELYKGETDLKPVLLYSGVKDSDDSYNKIISRQAKIIVCVDMLGEGFDLPELKIAAFHDIRKSLPITLQFAGRFTRTKHDEELGNASFIANIADLDVRTELADLYALDADWNQILSKTSFGKIKNEEEFKDLMAGFKNLSNSKIPFQNIKPKLSAVVFRNKTNEWFPLNYSKGIPGFDNLEYKFFDINRDEKILVIILARKENVEWINTKDIYLIQWDVILVHWETKNNLLFINSSDNGSLYSDLAKAIIGENAELVRGIDVFKVFHNIKRTRLQNVGLKYFLGKNERFRMSVGSDVAEALSIAERQKGEKAFVMGIGFENGDPVNIGASYKGRVWSKLSGDIMQFKEWCLSVGDKLTNTTIDPNQILRETLIPQQVSEIPPLFPVWIDWDFEMYMTTENKFKFTIDGFRSDMSSTELNLETPTISNSLKFSIQNHFKSAVFELTLFENTNDPENVFPDFSIKQLSGGKVEVQYGSRSNIDIIKFFEEFTPTFWFANGSALTGNDFVELKQTIGHYPQTHLLTWNWMGVNLRNESQGVNPKVIDSIQYKVIEELKKTDVDIIYDDDYSGEIADVVTLKLHDDKIKVCLYHLKYAIEGKVSNNIKNFYEVCGQAQKSVHWKHKEGSEFVNHLLRRETKERNGSTCSRLEKGTVRDLEKLLEIAKKEIPFEYEIYIVQPGVSKTSISTDILTLLGVTENFTKEIGGINLTVIVSN